NNPGPGLFPLVLGAVLGVLSLMILAGGVMAKRAAVQGAQATGGRSIYSKEALYVVLALIGFGFLLVPLGFIVTTFAVFAAMLRFVTGQKWAVVVIGALVLALGAYVVFDMLLGVPLPRGVLGI
ncbi:MAG: tripartite tricarboxylate transporter TctB family protein, partial [Proteobacteria bacterium]|nr:tripartite tricarboxylate transporter TctB family protein [Pseudomonadota bacterium]